MLLPVEYYHVVFTLPAEVADAGAGQPGRALRPAVPGGRRRRLRDVAANPKRLGAQVGVLMVLHTWGQNLHHHPHVHASCTGGGLSCNARGMVDTDTALAFVPARLLPAGAGAEPRVPRQVSWHGCGRPSTRAS